MKAEEGTYRHWYATMADFKIRVQSASLSGLSPDTMCCQLVPSCGILLCVRSKRGWHPVLNYRFKGPREVGLCANAYCFWISSRSTKMGLCANAYRLHVHRVRSSLVLRWGAERRQFIEYFVEMGPCAMHTLLHLIRNTPRCVHIQKAWQQLHISFHASQGDGMK